jgi:glucosamine--fructose-6-phosphate aminotransferase (isomerizing)
MNPYIQDILAQPQALAATLQQLPQAEDEIRSLAAHLASRRFSRIVLTGMGSSLAALYPLWFKLVRAGYTPILIETSELLYEAANLITADTLLIVVSQSGRSVEIVRLIEQQQGATVLAVTNNADSPLAQAAAVAVITAAGAESNVSCKTYVTALAALALVGDILAPNPGEPMNWEQLWPVVDAMTVYLDRWEQHTATLGDLLAGGSLIICGRGSSLAAVHYSALILKEAAKVHAEGLTAPQFRHGPMELASTAIRVLVYEGNAGTAALNHRLVEDISSAGGRAYLVGQTSPHESLRLPPGPAVAWPIFEILPMQLISVGLAWRNGLEPGQFYVGSKVTTVE